MPCWRTAGNVLGRADRGTGEGQGARRTQREIRKGDCSMTRDEAREAIKVLQHYADGGDVQCRSFGNPWNDLDVPIFNFFDAEYRIKPKPAEGWGTIWNDNDPETLTGHPSEETAKQRCVQSRERRVIRWREVTE